MWLWEAASNSDCFGCVLDVFQHIISSYISRHLLRIEYVHVGKNDLTCQMYTLCKNGQS